MSRLTPQGVTAFMESDSDSALVIRLQAADVAAFDEVHAALNRRLFSFLLRLSGRREVAEDLLEETWLRLVSHAHRLRADTRLAPWLFTVARNLHASYRRSRSLEDSHSSGLMGLWPAGHAEPSPFEAAAANELEQRVATALAALPATYREVLLLVGVEGFRPSDAAQMCGVSSEALRPRLSRARAEIARLIDGRPPSPPLRRASAPTGRPSARPVASQERL